MAYFFPSYFQKRLLRYALSRLDLIETDTLDLDDLGVTLGQRSVIDLKNVGIKINKLIDALDIPPAIEVTRASIDHLRLTIPADLHTSGIEIEVEGVQLAASIITEGRQVGTTKVETSSNSTSIPVGSSASSRISPLRVHDPGGRLQQDNYGHPLELSQVLPSSKDLAVSFLESEPQRKREELQAAINSQSQYLQRSSNSGSLDDDTGLGMPGGLTLPTFVANFLKGIADRLSLTIRDINILLEMSISQPGNKGPELFKFNIKVAEISVDGFRSDAEPQLGNVIRKSISAHQIEFFILADLDFDTRASSPNIPRSSRSQSRPSPADSENVMSDSEDTSQSSGSGQDTPRLKQTAVFESHGLESLPGDHGLHNASSSMVNTGLGIETKPSLRETPPAVAKTSSRLASSNTSRDPVGSTHAMSGYLTSQVYRQGADAEPTEEGNTIGYKPPTDNDDLSESKLFTHEEAESMYLSAVGGDSIRSSEGFNIPGAWGWADALEEPSGTVSHKDEDLANQPADSHMPVPVTSSSDIVLDEQIDQISEPPTGKIEERISLDRLESSRLRDTPMYRLCYVDACYLQLPLSKSDGQPELSNLSNIPSSSESKSPDMTGQKVSFMMDSAARQAESSRQDAQSRFIANGNDVWKLNIGKLIFELDLELAKILSRVAQQAYNVLSNQKDASIQPQKPNTADLTPELSIQLSLTSANFNFCEKVGRHPCASTVDGQRDSTLQSSPLFQLAMSTIVYEKASYSMAHQQFSVSKIRLAHLSESIVSFLDTVHVRDSIASSSMLRPHDLVITKSDTRFDLKLKPLHVSLNLASIDEVLTRSGGLSSLLDLGSSVVSSDTVKGNARKSGGQHTQKPHVRFNEPAKVVEPERDISAPNFKIDLRIAGSIIDLIGTSASIQLKSSAIKLALREDNVKINVDGAAIEGPILPGSTSGAELYSRLKGIQLHYSGSTGESDLDRLLSILTPSSDRYDDDDDIMVDTLLRQRRKGAVLRISIMDIRAGMNGFKWQSHLDKLADELSKLSSVTKYLPEDDRPGILIFALINKFEARVQPHEGIGPFSFKASLLEGAQINIPALAAAQISSWTFSQANDDIIVGTVLSEEATVMGPPMFMCRFIADEMEPTVRLKLSNTCFEYKIPTIITLTELMRSLESLKEPGTSVVESHQSSPLSSSSEVSSLSRKTKVSVVFRDSGIGLYPNGHSAKGLFLLSDATITHTNQKNGSATNLDVKKASLLIIDDADAIGKESGNVDHKMYFDQNDHIQQLTKAGFVPVGSMSSASAIIKVRKDKMSDEQYLDVEFRNNLLFLETCADSTQTLIQLLNGLSPPSPPSEIAKYRTEIVPIEDMLASFTGNAFVTEPGPEQGLQASQLSSVSELENEEDDEQDFLGNFYAEKEDDGVRDAMTESYTESRTALSFDSNSVHVAPVDVSAPSPGDIKQSMMAHSMLDFRTDHFETKSTVGGTAHRWNSNRNTYGLSSEAAIQRSPLKIRIRDVHIIWNLFDGYDWQATRDTISRAVKDIETKALARRPRSGNRLSPGVEDDDESVIGDFLFNSIYIGIPANKDPRDLAHAINHDIDDMISETGSYATGTTVTASPTRRQTGPRSRPQRLKLNRSKHHKIAIELAGVSADIVTFPPSGGEVESSVDVRVRNLEIFDHLPTSTWKKFATYMQDAGEREVETNMIHIELLTVKPVADLAASELVLKLTVLPLRLHVDQDALDFFSRFFEFKDDRAPVSPPSVPPFLQRVEVNPVRIKLDFKPKRVDYGGLRSGRTTEFMNFFILDRADMVLRRVILYGVSGFDRLGIMLNNIWSPDVRRNQLPGVLAGLAPIRPIVDVGSGVRDLIAVPMREYRKDGRIVRSIQKGALVFAKTTATELVNLGAKLAIGTQQVLQNTEELLVSDGKPEAEEQDEETKHRISLYADQPLGIVQGLRGAYASLERDLLLAKDAIVAVPGEIMNSGSAAGAAKAMLKQSPTIILRPAIGATKAVGQTLLGAGNTLDKQNLRRVEEKYKRH